MNKHVKCKTGFPPDSPVCFSDAEAESEETLEENEPKW